jgi:hypothetical protein
MAWSVRVLDDGSEIPIETSWMSRLGGSSSYSVVRPVSSWPAGKKLELVATQEGSTMTERHTVTTSGGPMHEPPSCAWPGPFPIQPRGPTLPPGSWPTNLPAPAENERTFVLPPVSSRVGYVVAVRLWLQDGARAWCTEGALDAGRTESIGLTPSGDDFTDAAKIVGLVVTDLAGNSARYGATTD